MSEQHIDGLGIGAALREARDAKGWALEDVGRTTKIRSEYLRALEAEEFVRMGGDVYAKGFLKSYALALGLDPEPLLVIYRRRVQGTADELSGSLARAPVAREPRGAPPMWLAWAGVGLVVMIGIVALANIVNGTAPDPARQQRPPAAVTSEPVETPTPTPTPTPSATFTGVNLVLSFTSESWVRVTIDGVPAHEAVMASGSELTFDGDENILVRFGNAGGVRVQLNGKDLGLVGEAGRVEERTYTQSGSA